MRFKSLPSAMMARRDVWFGAAATAVLFFVGKYLWAVGQHFDWPPPRQQRFAISYGAAGSVIILLVWVFYSAQTLFYGAKLTQL